MQGSEGPVVAPSELAVRSGTEWNFGRNTWCKQSKTYNLVANVVVYTKCKVFADFVGGSENEKRV